MPNKDVVMVILAAGKGTRLKSSLAKVLHPAGGRPLVDHVVRCCAPLKPKKIVAVVGHQAEQVTAVVDPLDAQTVLQQPQHGTGHAMLVAKRALGNVVFLLKMCMLATAIAATLGFQSVLKRDLAGGATDLAPAHVTVAKITGLVSLVLWVGIAVAGRLIAYTS